MKLQDLEKVVENALRKRKQASITELLADAKRKIPYATLHRVRNILEQSNFAKLEMGKVRVRRKNGPYRTPEPYERRGPVWIYIKKSAREKPRKSSQETTSQNFTIEPGITERTLFAPRSGSALQLLTAYDESFRTLGFKITNRGENAVKNCRLIVDVNDPYLRNSSFESDMADVGAGDARNVNALTISCKYRGYQTAPEYVLYFGPYDRPWESPRDERLARVRVVQAKLYPEGVLARGIPLRFEVRLSAEPRIKVSETYKVSLALDPARPIVKLAAEKIE